ncbi:hypothetical protein COCSUDRAFT_60714 [Coccomyxa subellipsoidea C-169]|uniref:Uncharacterized protein n=1 Tax=Coccomyxa subellipsoidea (strain C-169) TaxID=574566 RepID=I0Z4Y0_COCSC|nr:hypothetical protein COCSUDRAFT_60714 [Coccomyxa subellipsoidea C-169]EIE25699.1 hypothetical protein COCSUDRAFT_60714 [Coccomyxa subellipsoidea C-169]|eukprot:XP_005650243.1 hypothetical protein COCSUDRAFT_60714 [Coccomyxa subellipsoidea C-169]
MVVYGRRQSSYPEQGQQPRAREPAEEPAKPAWPFDPDKINIFSALHDTVEGEIKVIAEVARKGDCLAMRACSVRPP